MVLCALAVLLSQAVALAQPATLASLTGTITVRRAQNPQQTLQLNDPVIPGDELTTGENSEAVIRTADGSTVRIFPDSRVVFSDPRRSVRDLVRLFLGSVKIQIERITGRPNPQRLSTPSAVIAVRGTVFSVFVDDQETTLVAVDEGLVAVSSLSFPAEEIVLAAGQRSFVRRGFRPMQAQGFRGNSERAAEAMPGRALGRERAMAAQSANTPPGRALGRPQTIPPARPPIEPPGLRRRPGPPR